MRTPKVSVVIPVYNTAAYLEKAVRSIMNQSMRDIEIVIVNDGSTDESDLILARLSAEDSRIFIVNQSNQGLSIARNEGFGRCSGEYVYYFDSDDYLQLDALSELYDVAKAHDCDFVLFDAVLMRHPTPEAAKHLPYQRKGILDSTVSYSGVEAFKILKARHKFSTSVCLHLIKRAFLDHTALSFYPKILHEDQLFTFLLYMQAKVVRYVPRDFFLRRLRENSIMTSAFTMRNADGLLAVCDQLLECLSRSKADGCECVDLIRGHVRMLVRTVASSSLDMPFNERMSLLKRLFNNYSSYLNLQSVTLLICPKLKLRRA